MNIHPNRPTDGLAGTGEQDEVHRGKMSVDIDSNASKTAQGFLTQRGFFRSSGGTHGCREREGRGGRRGRFTAGGGKSEKEETEAVR